MTQEPVIVIHSPEPIRIIGRLLVISTTSTSYSYPLDHLQVMSIQKTNRETMYENWVIDFLFLGALTRVYMTSRDGEYCEHMMRSFWS